MRLHDDMFVGGQFAWFTGVVEDVNDSEYLNRVKVRAFGYHSDDKAEVSTSDLPWATVMASTLNAGHRGVGSNHQLAVGSWVIGFFRDGPSAQDPIILGSVATSQPDGTLDIPAEAQVSGNTNAVYKSSAGHLVELDNTLNARRIKVTHSKGTSILIDNDGNVTIDASSGTTNENVKHKVTIIGDTTITGKLDVSDEVTAKFNTDDSVALTTHTHSQGADTTGDKESNPETNAPTAGT